MSRRGARTRRRYLIVKIEPANTDLAVDSLETILLGAIIRLWGAEGLAKINPKLIYLDKRRQLAVVRVDAEGVERARLAFELFPRVAPIVVRVVRVTGTVRKALRIIKSTPVSET